MAKKNFAVFGLGRFGMNVALTLEEMGYDVLGVDKDENVVANLSEKLTRVVSFDIRDVRALKEAGIDHPNLKTARPIESLSYNVSANLGIALSPARHEFNEPGLSAYVIKGSPQVELGIAWKKETMPSKIFISILDKLISKKE